MKKVISTLTFVVLCLLLITISGCAKNGCNDKTADNYNPNSKENDGSCSYSAELIFWWQKPLRDSCALYGITNTPLLIKGDTVGTLAIGTKYWVVAQKPSCGENGTITHIEKLSPANEDNISIKYFLGNTSIGKLLVLTPGCNQYEIVWE